MLLGDFLDLENVSPHTRNRPRLRKRGGYRADTDGFKRDILDPLDNLLKPTCRKTAICGNHDSWIQSNLFDEQPELEGVVDIPLMLDLAARNWCWVPCGGHIKIGNVTVLHGDQIGSGPNIAKKLLESVHGSAVMGHVHRPSMFTLTSLTTAKDKWSGYTLPRLYYCGTGLCEGTAQRVLYWLRDLGARLHEYQCPQHRHQRRDIQLGRYGVRPIHLRP